MLQSQSNHSSIPTALYHQSVNSIFVATQRVCVETARYCMEQGGDFVAQVRLLLDTAALCHTVTHSQPYTISACATLCGLAATACDHFPQDQRLSRCASLCRQCMMHCVDTNTITVA